MSLNLTTYFLETCNIHPLQYSGKIALTYDTRYVRIMIIFRQKPFELLLVKLLGILSTKSCFRMVGRPMIMSMLVLIVLAIRRCSSSVLCLSYLNKSKLNTSFLIANYRICTSPCCQADSCWLVVLVRR